MFLLIFLNFNQGPAGKQEFGTTAILNIYWIMVLILDSDSEHAAHAGTKMGLLDEKIRFSTDRL